MTQRLVELGYLFCLDVMLCFLSLLGLMELACLFFQVSVSLPPRVVLHLMSLPILALFDLMASYLFPTFQNLGLIQFFFDVFRLIVEFFPLLFMGITMSVLLLFLQLVMLFLIVVDVNFLIFPVLGLGCCFLPMISAFYVSYRFFLSMEVESYAF